MQIYLFTFIKQIKKQRNLNFLVKKVRYCLKICHIMEKNSIFAAQRKSAWSGAMSYSSFELGEYMQYLSIDFIEDIATFGKLKNIFLHSLALFLLYKKMRNRKMFL